MKIANHINIRVFIKPEEDKEALENTFFNLIGLNREELKEEKIELYEKNAKGFSDRTIKILHTDLEKDKHCNKFLDKLKTNLGSEDKRIIRNKELDEDLNIYIRLDKKQLTKGIYEVTEDGNCFHTKISIAAFPKRIEIARKVVEELFS